MPELREIPFHEFQRGDIVCFRRPDGAEVIHRVYHTAPEALTTWGDNNLRPDPEPVRAEWNPRLAVGFRRGDNRFLLPRGHAGMRQFRFNRLRFHLRRLCGIPFRFLARGARWWGIRQLEYETFARDRHYFYRGKPIARKRKNGPLEYRRWYYRLFFFIQEDDSVSR